jgi:hypothetical protein
MIICTIQIVRAAIYKELKRLDYRELEYEQSDSRICEHFMKIDTLRPYSFQLFQKYIAKTTSKKTASKKGNDPLGGLGSVLGGLGGAWQEIN